MQKNQENVIHTEEHKQHKLFLRGPRSWTLHEQTSFK